MKHVINQRKMLTSALTQFLTDLLPDLLSRPLLRAIVLAVNSTSSYCNCKPIVYVHIYSIAHLSQLLTMPLIFTALRTVCVQPPYLLLPSCLSVCLSHYALCRDSWTHHQSAATWADHSSRLADERHGRECHKDTLHECVLQRLHGLLLSELRSLSIAQSLASRHVESSTCCLRSLAGSHVTLSVLTCIIGKRSYDL